MVRRRLRDEIVKLHLLERMVHDIKILLSDSEKEKMQEEETVYLWDNIKDKVKNGRQYYEDGGKEDGSDNDE